MSQSLGYVHRRNDEQAHPERPFLRHMRGCKRMFSALDPDCPRCQERAVERAAGIPARGRPVRFQRADEARAAGVVVERPTRQHATPTASDDVVAALRAAGYTVTPPAPPAEDPRVTELRALGYSITPPAATAPAATAPAATAPAATESLADVLAFSVSLTEKSAHLRRSLLHVVRYVTTDGPGSTGPVNYTDALKLSVRVAACVGVLPGTVRVSAF